MDDITGQEVDLNTYEQTTEDVADQVDGSADDGDSERIKNLQREFERKLNNTADLTQKQLQQLAETQQKLLEQFSTLSTSKQESEEDLENLMYSDPKAYAAKIKEMTKNEVLQEVKKSTESYNSKTAALQSAVNEAISQFPELSQSNNPLTQRVYSIVGSDPAKIDPKDLKLAVYQAATELNIAPINQRKAAMSKNDDFSGLSSKGQKGKSPKSSNSGVLPEGVKAWAQALGLNLNDPTTKKRLEARVKRDWIKFQPVERDLNQDLED